MTLAALLEAEAVILQMEARSASDVIATLGDRLNQLGYVDDDFVTATLAREAQHPTGLPLGGRFNAAIPHTDAEHIRKPGVALATLKAPVSFHNMVSASETVPVQLVIVLAVTDAKAQVELLQQVATILQQPKIVEDLMAALSSEEVVKILSRLEAMT
ncbi:MAG TPA: PTS sugar transporter subunit IIA [Anaerolineae bacterium]